MGIRPVPTFEKFPDEKFTQAVDFADLLADSETISSCAATALNRETGAEASSQVIHGSATISSTRVLYTVKAGEPEQKYLISVTATTSLGNVFEQWVEMRIPAEVVTE